MENIKEQINNEERIFTGHLVKVNKLDVTLPNGAPAMREVVRHPGASAIVPVDKDGNVILVKQFRCPIADILLEIPAGKLDHKGEDRLEAAKRELAEETGLTAGNWVHLIDMLTTPGFCDEVISIYLATDLSQGDTNPDDDEFLHILKMPLTELVKMAQNGELHDSKTVTGILLADKALRKE